MADASSREALAPRDDDVQRLNQYLHDSETLLCACPAVLRCVTGGSCYRRVWLGVARVDKVGVERTEHIVAIFGRATIACMRGRFLSSMPPALASLLHGEFVYCVLPVAANIRVDIEQASGGGESCIFKWTQHENHAGGDCRLDVPEEGYAVLETLQKCYTEASRDGAVFHEEQRASEIWSYRRQLPLHLAKLPQAAVVISGRRGDLSRRTAGRKTLRGLTRMGSLFDASSDRELRVLCVTWNVGATLPLPDQSLAPLIRGEEGEPEADLIAVGLQETCVLSAMRLIQDGDEWAKWKDWVAAGVQEVHGEHTMRVLSYVHLVGMLLVTFVRDSLCKDVSRVWKSGTGIGVGGVGGNKGAVGIRFELGATSVCFVNAHLAAGQAGYIDRCQHFRLILQKMLFREGSAPADISGDGGSVSTVDLDDAASGKASFKRDQLRSRKTMSFMTEAGPTGSEAFGICDHDHIFWIGDTNSRLHWASQTGGIPIEQARRKVEDHRIGELLALDQLNLMRRDGLAFHGFREHEIRFLPSYKWTPHCDRLDMRSQKHVPGWCDRILFRSMTRPVVKVHEYQMHPDLKQSDHRPVFARCSLVARDVASGGSDAEGDSEGSDASSRVRSPRDGRRMSESASRQPITPESLTTEPTQLRLRCVKPDRAEECILWLVYHGSGDVNFEVFVTRPDGSEVAPSLRVDSMDDFTSPGSTAAQDSDVHLASWLSVSAVEGVISEGYPEQLWVSVRIQAPVLKRQKATTALVVRLSNAAGSMDFQVPVDAFLEPSIMRAPLALLTGLGRLPLLADKARATDGFGVPFEPQQLRGADGGPLLPPKETVATMMWLLQRSRETLPGALVWWSDPFQADAKRDRDVQELARHLERGQPLPADLAAPRSATLLLLRWLSMLPAPVLSPGCADAFAASGPPARGAVAAAAKQLLPMHASVLLCVASLWAQLTKRHGDPLDRAGAMDQLARSLTHQDPPSAASVALVEALLAELAACSFPPLQVLAAAP